MAEALDAVVVGAGPNGLAAAIALARAGRSVVVLEAADEIGGGTRTAELTLPGFHHDVCSAVHPLALASPFLSSLPLADHGLRWLHPDIALAHPLDDGRAGLLYRSLDDTAGGLERSDGRRWRRLMGPIVDCWPQLSEAVLGPVTGMARHPIAMAHFGARATWPSTTLSQRWFSTDEARGLFAGNSAHAIVPLSRPLTSSFGVLLAVAAHAVGWPVAEGGSSAIARAMASHLTELGGEIHVNRRVSSMADIPESRVVLFDLAPRQVTSIVGDQLSARYRRRLERFRHGPGAFKVDFALSGPVPWANPQVRRSGTVHVGGTASEVRSAEAEVARGGHPERPFVLVTQPSVIDPTRAPAGQHTLWAYCHVPSASTVDMTERIEAQIERFAPGFRDLVLARHAAGPSWFEQHNEAYVGGDIAGGSLSGLQVLFRPTVTLRPYRTPNERFFMCSASTPPGAGVHGMAGYHAARVALATALR